MAPKRPNISEKSCQYFFGRLAKTLVRQIVDYKDKVIKMAIFESSAKGLIRVIDGKWPNLE